LFFLNERAAYYTVKEVRLRLSIYISNNNKRENNSTEVDENYTTKTDKA